MKRTPFKRKTPLRSRHEPTYDRAEHAAARLERIANQRPPMTLHKGVMTKTAAMTAAPKPDSLQHEGYMRLVRTFPCEHCGRAGPSEFAHADQGKGQGIKSDCRIGTSLCKWRSPEEPGCHWLIGTKRIYPKAQRRELEEQMAARTRARVIAAGQWPKNLPMLEER
jgi:hypothetical protein